jgi:hypothetical protein
MKAVAKVAYFGLSNGTQVALRIDRMMMTVKGLGY